VCGIFLILAPIHEFGHWFFGNIVGYRVYFSGWTYVSTSNDPYQPWQDWLCTGAGPTFEIVAYTVIACVLAYKYRFSGAFFFLGQLLYFPIRFYKDDEWYLLMAYGKMLIPASLVLVMVITVTIWANMEKQKYEVRRSSGKRNRRTVKSVAPKKIIV
jgi:hypothetical protein